jgi:hypothetical protein
MRSWRRHPDHPGASAVLAAEPAALLRAPHRFNSSDWRVILERARSASRPGERADHHLEKPIELCWQPVVYRSSAVQDDDAQSGAAQG